MFTTFSDHPLSQMTNTLIFAYLFLSELFDYIMMGFSTSTRDSHNKHCWVFLLSVLYIFLTVPTVTHFSLPHNIDLTFTVSVGRVTSLVQLMLLLIPNTTTMTKRIVRHWDTIKNRSDTLTSIVM